MSDPANEAQLTTIGNQLFDIWEVRQAAKQSKLRGSWPAWAAFGLSIGAIVWAGGGHQRQIAENTRRIEAVETRQSQQTTDSQQVLERLASIEAKLDLMTEERKR